MERRELEDRIRASLEARATDVQPTPELWERVSAQTTRRARWQLAGWVLSGAAAVLAIVVGGVVLLGSPRSVQIDPQPDIADTPDQAPVPGDTADATIVTTDGSVLYVVEPGTGEVRAELDPRAGLQPVDIREVVVRPVTDAGVLTVAMTVENEGEFDVEVAAFDADGQRVDHLTLGMAGSPGTSAGLPPSPVWSADGRYVMWAGTNGPSSPALWVYDWVERPVDADGIAQPSTATAPGADGELFADGATVDLHTWTGPSGGESVVVATTPTGQAWQIGLAAQASDCGGATPCPPTWRPAISSLGFEGGSLVDRAVLDSGVELSLVARSGDGADAESGTVELVVGAMGDQQRGLEVPELTEGTASPGDAWLAAAGDQVAVGFGPQAAYLLTVTGDTIEGTEVTDTVTLPAGTLAAGMAVAGDAPTAAPSDPPPSDSVDGQPIDLVDGVPAHVITNPQRDELQLVDRRDPDQPLAAWRRPDTLVSEAAPVHVAVHPASTPTDLQVVTRWTVGESESLVHTLIRDGLVVVNEVLPDDMQPSNQGTIAEMGESTPVFSPDGQWLAWVETPQGADGSAQVRFVPWSADGPTGGALAALASDDSPRPFELLDWAREGDAAVLTLRPASEPGTDAQQPTSMIELRLPGGDPTAPAPTWGAVELPGVLFEAGSYAFEGGVERYVAFARDGDVVAGLASAPETAVPTGAFAFSEGRVVAFGPTSALVQQPDGTWQRVQLDDGASSAVEVPEAAVAVLPWPAG